MIAIKGASILITGGCGFIGGHLVRKLVLRRAKITVVDIALDPKSIFAQNNLEKKTVLKFVDIRDREKILKIIKRYRPSYVIHLAAQPLVQDAYFDPYSNFETNIMGTVNILEAVRLNQDVKGVIVASSDKAYGKNSQAYTEDMPLQGDHPYDVSKACEDLIARAYHQTYGFPVVITRFGNVYGEGDLHFDRIIPGICKAIVNNEILRIRSDGSPVRDYIYVEDVVRGYLFLLKNLKKVQGEAYNFSSPDNLSVMELIKKTQKNLGIKIKYKFLNNAKNEIPFQRLNDTKIKKLGWKNQHSLTTKLTEVLSWYRENLYEGSKNVR